MLRKSFVNDVNSLSPEGFKDNQSFHHPQYSVNVPKSVFHALDRKTWAFFLTATMFLFVFIVSY